MGADAIVTGVLRPDGSLDTEEIRTLLVCAGDAGIALHRAFDMCENPLEALEQVCSLGVKSPSHQRTEKFRLGSREHF